MSRYKLVHINEKYLAELALKTGGEEILTKASRGYVGLYDTENCWYIPLRAKLQKGKPTNSIYPTPFKTNNPHFVNPGLDFQKSLFVPQQETVVLAPVLPRDQATFIDSHLDDIQQKFESYVLSVDSLNHNSPSYLYSTISLFPEGVEHLKQVIAKRSAKRPCSLSDDLQAARLAANKQESINPQGTLKHTQKH